MLVLIDTAIAGSLCMASLNYPCDLVLPFISLRIPSIAWRRCAGGLFCYSIARCRCTALEIQTENPASQDVMIKFRQLCINAGR